MNIINNSILIIILLLLANYLSNGSILQVLMKYYNLLINFIFSKSEEFTNIISEKSRNFLFSTYDNDKLECTYKTCDFPPDLNKIYNSEDIDDPEENLYKINKFLDSLIDTKNNLYELTPSNAKEINLNNNEVDIINKFLIKSLKSKDIRFDNISIVDKLSYYSNPKGKEMKPFKFSTDVYIDEKAFGKLTIYLEMFIKNDEIFLGYPSITRIRIKHKDNIENILAYSDRDSDSSLIPDSIVFSMETEAKYDFQNIKKNSYRTESSIEIPDMETTSEIITTQED